MIDYEKKEFTIQQAMLDSLKKSKFVAGHPPQIKWGDLVIQTSDLWQVEAAGRVSIEFLHSDESVEQGVDISLNGCLELSDGERIDCLRTWRDARYEDVVEYPFQCNDGKLYVWNVYKIAKEGGGASKWTGNSGFWIEYVSPRERIYHCSHGLNDVPNFNSLIFGISIS